MFMFICRGVDRALYINNKEPCNYIIQTFWRTWSEVCSAVLRPSKMIGQKLHGGGGTERYQPKLHSACSESSHSFEEVLAAERHWSHEPTSRSSSEVHL